MRGIVYPGDRAEVTDDARGAGPGTGRRHRPDGGRRRVPQRHLGASTAPSPGRRRPSSATRGPGSSKRSALQVTRVKPGDHVVVATVANCGMCKWCNIGPADVVPQLHGQRHPALHLQGPAGHQLRRHLVVRRATVIKEIQAVPISDAVSRSPRPPCSAAASSPASVPCSTGPRCDRPDGRGVRRRRGRAELHPGLCGSPGPRGSSPSTPWRARSRSPASSGRPTSSTPARPARRGRPPSATMLGATSKRRP